jgi:PIN domain nuclease of toxin-antitoxin system
VTAYLLDTHVLLWAIREPKRLSASVKRVLENPHSLLYVSSISPWEMAMKYRIGKLDEAVYVLPNLNEHLQTLGAQELSFTIAHSLETSSIGLPQADPFDRALAAQAKLEGLTFISADELFDQAQGLKVLW